MLRRTRGRKSRRRADDDVAGRRLADEGADAPACAPTSRYPTYFPTAIDAKGNNDDGGLPTFALARGVDLQISTGRGQGGGGARGQRRVAQGGHGRAGVEGGVPLSIGQGVRGAEEVRWEGTRRGGALRRGRPDGRGRQEGRPLGLQRRERRDPEEAAVGVPTRRRRRRGRAARIFQVRGGVPVAWRRGDRRPGAAHEGQAKSIAESLEDF
mmetsp:Transcript_32740/g.69739  ORF Transcript_32740/g.69739 Transcript_32740/m.69739 type:complete len:211 (-) Transcript_32740:1171-1803(-)